MLTNEHKEFIRANAAEVPDLIELTRAAFMDDTIDGRSKEGRSVRAFCVKEKIDFKTTKHEKVKQVSLGDDQKEFVIEYVKNGMNAYQIASLLFPDSNITPLSKETLVVTEYINANAPSEREVLDSESRTEYLPPQTSTVIVNKVNEYSGEDWQPNKLSLLQRDCVQALKRFLSSPRFIKTIGTYTIRGDRELFEAEFVRATFDKSDLTADEVNLYINVCIDYINLIHIQQAMSKLNDMFNDAETQQEMTVRLAELLKTKSEEYNQCEKRMESLISKLQGDRSKRIQSKNQGYSSILSLVNVFQDQEERERMVMIAEMQKAALSKEVDAIEAMPAWKARILGIGKSEIL
jgi:undecaprenyl pyrophosphate synthase